MTAFGALVVVTLRGLLGRRRTLLMVLLAALPILVGLLIRLGGGRERRARDPRHARDPDGPAAHRARLRHGGHRLRDRGRHGRLPPGEADRPLADRRWPSSGSRPGLTAALVVPPIIVTAFLVEGFGGDSLATAVGFALAAIAGGTAYAVAFAALGVVTTRALVVGLAYTLLWEGVLAGLLEGTRFLSIRQATLGVAAALTGEDVGRRRPRAGRVGG